MFGPHFYYDLIRLARNRRNVYLRCGYLAALMIAWWIVYEKSQPFAGHINDYARLATNFTQSLLIFQYVMIALLAPIYLASTIVEERESRTLELIFQTHLTDREILLGKFAARVVHLMFFALLSLPMLAIITLWGGVNMELLAMHFGFSLLMILFLGSMCLWVSVTARRYTEAMILAYVIEFAMLYYTAPIVVAVLEGRRGIDLPALWMQGLVALPFLGGTWFFYWIASRQFRRLRDLNWIKRVNPPARPRVKRAPKPRVNRILPPTPPIPDNALIWKEMEYHRPLFETPPILAWIGLGVMTLLAVMGAIMRLAGPDLRTGLEALIMLCILGYCGLLGALFIIMATQSTPGVAREREQNTLDFLLLLPVERAEILFIKWLAPWMRNRVLIVVTLATPLVCSLFGVFPVRTGLALVLLPWPLLLFVSALGLLLSVICRRVAVANLIGLAVLVVIFALHLLFWRQFTLMFQGYLNLLVQHEDVDRLAPALRTEAMWLIVSQQAWFLLLALACLLTAFRLFSIRSSEVRTIAG